MSPTPAGCILFEVDFYSLPDGTVLIGGDYISSQYKPFYGLELAAFGGLGTLPRLFNTAEVGNATYGDPDLGSSNKSALEEASV
jgi:hypothetical protein